MQGPFPRYGPVCEAGKCNKDKSKKDVMVMAEGTALLGQSRPGTKTQDFYHWPDESFGEMESTLALQQYIQQNMRADCSNIDKIPEAFES